ncbi:ATP-binding cassette sub-family F member 2-like [Schistocerca gregaria]|uniref:ATP-binding cassette sub-family F member 2-like n=1 Tax=Schistocerca gregaria TaxID=7010 RepID=UPI00211DA66C|nr:ATP-binding cassette sub-family F member 2-like [Schistocerca gregaria]
MGRNAKKSKGRESREKQVEPRVEKVVELPYMATGTLASSPMCRDIKIENFSVQIYGRPLVVDTTLELNKGRRYSLIGTNGSGKSIMLKCLGSRLVPIPPRMDVYILDREAEANELSALESIMEGIDGKVAMLEAEAEKLALIQDDVNAEECLQDIYEQLDELDPECSRVRATKILHGLGFSTKMQNQKCKDFSGGWRMRIALAKALFMKPDLLLLDEPTNHLDLEACVWLESYLKKYDRILLLISHSQDFLNEVCTNIIHLHNGRLIPYGGNYDQYVRTRSNKEENQMKRYQWEQEQIRHMKEYIGRFGSGNAKMASQAKSKEKVLEKMESKGLTEKVVADKVLSFHFPCVGKLPPPVVSFNDVEFGYDESRPLYRKLDFGIDLDSRIALVGANGVGKSTLLKLITRQVIPTRGQITCHQSLRIGYYNQHLNDQLDGNLSPLEYMMKEYDVEPQTLRKIIGRFGVTGRDQTTPIKILSDGIKSRVVFAWIAFKEPHLLLLDEPTNHLDMESIDALANAINGFEGGMVLVSHDFRLISQVARELWVCTPEGIKPFDGGIERYKRILVEKIENELEG